MDEKELRTRVSETITNIRETIAQSHSITLIDAVKLQFVTLMITVLTETACSLKQIAENTTRPICR